MGEKIQPLKRRVSECCGAGYQRIGYTPPQKQTIYRYQCLDCLEFFDNPVPKFPKKEEK